MTPFLLGLHQTIDGWRSYRHEYGWKMQHAAIMAAKCDDEVAEVEEDDHRNAFELCSFYSDTDINSVLYILEQVMRTQKKGQLPIHDFGRDTSISL
jgi:hypothetical protein